MLQKKAFCKLIKKEFVYRPHYVVWSAAYMQHPRDNILINHFEGRNVQKQKNFIQINKKAISSFRGKFVKAEKKSPGPKKLNSKKQEQNKSEPPYIDDYFCGLECDDDQYYELIIPQM